MEPSGTLRTLSTFRHSFYECLHRRADALFELTDALLTADSVPSPVHLSLEASHRRGWGSLYAALDRARIDDEALRKLLARHPLARAPKGRRPSTPWTQACGHAATPRRAPYSRLLLPPVPPLSGAAHRRRLGLAVRRPSQLRPRELERPRGCGARPARPRRQRGRRRAGEGLARPARKRRARDCPCSSSMPARTPSSCSASSRGARARSSSACAPGGASTATLASVIRLRTSDAPVATGRR
jgi:hypothetical protein